MESKQRWPTIVRRLCAVGYGRQRQRVTGGAAAGARQEGGSTHCSLAPEARNSEFSVVAIGQDLQVSEPLAVVSNSTGERRHFLYNSLHARERAKCSASSLLVRGRGVAATREGSKRAPIIELASGCGREIKERRAVVAARLRRTRKGRTTRAQGHTNTHAHTHAQVATSRFWHHLLRLFLVAKRARG